MTIDDRRLDDHEVPTWIAVCRRENEELHLRGVAHPWDRHYRTSRVLLIDNGRPHRWLLWEGAPPTGAELARHFGDEAPPNPPPARRMSATVVVCTRDRPDMLRRCLQSLRSGLDPDAHVLVVDSAPRNSSNLDVVEEFAAGGLAIRRVVEPRPGLSRARNVALTASTSEVVAFIDDDVLVEPGWLGPLRGAFGRDDKIAVAVGLVPSAEVETAAQLEFERRIPWSTRLTPAQLSMGAARRLRAPFPYNAGQIGTGANMALRRSVAIELGGFDPALGAGTWTRGGEDLELFVRALRAGWEIAYEPASVVWHLHEPSMKALRSKVFAYGAGASAYLVSVLSRPGRRDVVAAVMPLARFALDRRREHVRTDADVRLESREVLGLLWGPLAYGAERLRQSQWRVSTTTGTHPA